MGKQIASAFRIMVLFTVLTGLIYPAVVTGLCQLLFPRKANGSQVEVNGQVVGSTLLGQNFAKPEYFHPRPSAAGQDGYDGMASGGSNYGPTNRKLIDRVGSSVTQFRRENPGYTGPIPADLLTASASGLDPDISPASAEAQVDRVARARRVSPLEIRRFVEAHIEKREFGFLGELRVNVLALNVALDDKFPAHH